MTLLTFILLTLAPAALMAGARALDARRHAREEAANHV
jgi:hypothetical protein